MMLRYCLTALIHAWETLLEIPVPGVLKEKTDDIDVQPSAMLACFPVVGFVIALAIYLIFSILHLFIGNPAAAVIATISAIILLEAVSYGKNLTMLIKLIEAVAGKPGDDHAADPQTIRLFAFSTIYLIRLLCLGFIFYHNVPGWLLIILPLSYSVQAHMATLPDNDGDALIEVEDEQKAGYHWIISIAFLLTISALNWHYFLFAVIALMLAYFYADKAFQFCNRKFGSVSGAFIGLSGYLLETLLLLLGLILLVKH